MLFWESSGAMGFHSMLVLVTWLGVMLTPIVAAAAIAYPLALPNCSDSCGDVKIHIPLAQLKVVTGKMKVETFLSTVATRTVNLNQ